MPHVVVGARTDVGHHRSLNEDALLVGERVWVVADGMGGHAAGDVASSLAVQSLRALEGAEPLTPADVPVAVERANDALVEYGGEHPEARGMGTTVTGVAEVSIYVGEKFRGKGLGYHLLTALCREAEQAGYWTLQSTVLQDNAPSRGLHLKCGFRVVGRRERIARDCHGRWLDTYLMERRCTADEPVGYKKL